MRASRCEIQDATHAATSPFGQFGLPLVLATLLDLQIQAHVGHDLIQAGEASQISHLCAQHRHRPHSQFRDP